MRRERPATVLSMSSYQRTIDHNGIAWITEHMEGLVTVQHVAESSLLGSIGGYPSNQMEHFSGNESSM